MTKIGTKRIVFIFMIFICRLFAANTDAAVAEPFRYTVGGYIASPCYDTFKEAMRYAAQKDFDVLLNMIESNKIILLKDNQKVEVVKEKTDQKAVLIRETETRLLFWTIDSALKKELY